MGFWEEIGIWGFRSWLPAQLLVQWELRTSVGPFVFWSLSSSGPRLPLYLSPPVFFLSPLPILCFLFHLFLHFIFSSFQEEPGTPRAEGTGLSNSASFCHLLPTPTLSQSPANHRKPPRLSPPSLSERAAPGQEKTAALSHSLLDKEGALGVGGWPPLEGVERPKMLGRRDQPS